MRHPVVASIAIAAAAVSGRVASAQTAPAPPRPAAAPAPAQEKADFSERLALETGRIEPAPPAADCRD